MTTLSLVVPAYNEAHNLPRTLPLFAQLSPTLVHEIIFVDDGSTDATPALVTQWHAIDPRIRLLSLPRNQGKGAAIKAGLLAAQGAVIMYTDADLIYQLDELPAWIAYLQDAEIVNGNRRLPDSVFHVPTRLFPFLAKRAKMGLAFNRLVRWWLGVQTTDTQSGMKLFRADVAKRLAAATHENGFAFDVEFFALASVWRYRICDVPVHLAYRNEVSSVRLLRDGWRMLCAVWQIWRRMVAHKKMP